MVKFKLLQIRILHLKKNQLYNDTNNFHSDEEDFDHNFNRTTKSKVITPLKFNYSSDDTINLDKENNIKRIKLNSKFKISKRITKKGKQRIEESSEYDSDYSVCDSSNGSDYIGELVSDDEIENESNAEYKTGAEHFTNFNAEEKIEKKIKIHTFLLIKFAVPKGTKYYIGQVIDLKKDTNSVKVKFLRNKGNGRFAWPIVDDICDVFTIDIEKVLPDPVSRRRGIHIFNVKVLENYVIN